MEIDILGRRLSCHGLPVSVMTALSDCWHFPEHSAPATDRGATNVSATGYTLSIAAGLPDRPDRLRGEWVSVGGMSQPVEVRSDGAGFEYQDASGRLDCRHTEGHTEIRTEFTPAGPTGAAPSLPYTETLHLAVAEGLRCSGLLPLHVAGAVFMTATGPETSVFAGPSGTGKSTTLLHAVAAGGQPVAEDLMWYDPHSRLVYGWDRGIRLLPGSLSFLPARVRECDWPVSTDGKTNVPYSALSDSPVVRGGTPLSRFVVLTRSPGEDSRLEPLPRREAALAVWEAARLPLADEARAQVTRHIEELTRQVPFFRLHLGRTPLPFPGPALSPVAG